MRHRRLKSWATTAWLWLAGAFLAGMALAQEQTVLLADRLDVTSGGVLSASGNVQVIFGDAQVSASAIRFAPETGLEITGPIQLQLEDGTTLIFADQAQLDTDLQNGIIQGARMVLDARVQLAAAQIRRVDGRYTELKNTLASSCQICADNPTPLWQIRAKSIIHDQVAQRLYFDQPRFEFRGVQILSLPRISLPDPTAKRANGFLVPTFSTSDTLGLKLEIPYFVTLGDHADLTFSPLISARTRSLKLRYRRAFRSGTIELNGAISDDDIAAKMRAYLFAEGQFQLARGFELTFDAETTSDTSYLAEYGLSSKNRLDSQIAVERVRRDQLIQAELTAFQTLRGRELSFADTLPSLLGQARYEQYFDLSGTSIGGRARIGADATARWRSATTDVAGRDYLGLTFGADWQNVRILPSGIEMRMGLGAEIRADFVAQDSTYQPATTQTIPFAEVELRYPLIKTSDKGAFNSITPIVHLGWAERLGSTPPFEDGLLAELGAGNLFSGNRMPGRDDIETGAQLAAGLAWERRGPGGLDTNLLLGRIWRDEPATQFTAASGLSGRASDWLLATELRLTDQLSLSNTTLITEAFKARKSDTRLAFDGSMFSLAAAHSWSDQDPATNRNTPLSQLNLDGSYKFGGNWLGTGELTYDFETAKPIAAGLGMQFRNECLQLDLSLSRRFTGSGNILQNTDIGLEFAILGFGAGSNAGPAQSCVR